jgi:ATP-dependent helicase HepA
MLVTLPGRRGVGTVLNSHTDWSEVEVFHSIDRSDIEYFPTDTLQRAFAGPETRVYLKIGENWRVGRITNYDTATLPWIEYRVRFPNGFVSDVSEDQIRVRVFEPHADPSGVLASGGAETQFLHDRRWEALSSSVKLRSAAEGLTGALSAKIELVPHQLAAARRVLTDPVQRFLLADEVGMGKTIEAGIVARQCLIDDATRHIEILAPKPLIPQWTRELFDRFDLAEYRRQITFTPHDAVQAGDHVPDLLVVDEAHNLLGDEVSFGHLVQRGHATARLLLLSATPALGAPSALLRLLHVLDPNAYGADDLPKLIGRLEVGQNLGRVLLSLAEDAPSFLIKRAARDIATKLPDDLIVAELAKRLEAEEDVSELLADLRSHLADTYRVHQRLIRARRQEASVYFRPRGVRDKGARDHLRIEVDEDERWPEILVSLEDWRDKVRFEEMDDMGVRTDAALALFQAIDAIGCEDRTPLFEGAPASLKTSLSADAGDRTRVVVAAEAVRAILRRLEKEGQRAPKVVAFATTVETSDRLAAELSGHGVDASRLTYGDDPDTVYETIVGFERATTAAVLICDQSGEEGLNLNFADGILHVDLPLSVTRMEQRIGRLDRFGRSKALLRQRIVLPSDDDLSPWQAWLEVLTDGFEIFERSTSDVQFILPQLEAELACAYVERGVDGLRSMIEPIRDKIAAARRADDEQYALDSVALADDAGELTLRIDDAEADESDLQSAAEGWLVTALQLRRVDLGGDEVAYGWTQDTLIPRQPWASEFGTDDSRRSTWRRTVAMRRGATLLRPGSALIDTMERFMRWDDRGSAFATWRVDPRLSGSDISWIGFRFCFVIEPALENDLAVFRILDTHGLARRAQGFLPPWTQMLHHDLDGEVPPDEVSNVLASPYHSGVRDQGGRDINLSSQPALLASVMPPALFAKRCREARSVAEESIRRDPIFLANIQKAVRAAQRDARRRLRFDADPKSNGADAIIAAVQSPRVRLDSMGFFVLSRNPPARHA